MMDEREQIVKELVAVEDGRSWRKGLVYEIADYIIQRESKLRLWIDDAKKRIDPLKQEIERLELRCGELVEELKIRNEEIKLGNDEQLLTIKHLTEANETIKALRDIRRKNELHIRILEGIVSDYRRNALAAKGSLNQERNNNV